MPSVPLWLAALVFACAAPLFASALQAAMQARLRRRTSGVLARAVQAMSDGEAAGEERRGGPEG